ncbi:type II toxin-antitoxin system RelE/ParE family toxin [Candidatus Peregrinibacteria bacterium]|nr:type II toxin-antitoxin system RelE/ParE family toxin [Candidatus Peregrinibacteria bacterium]
MMCKIEFKSSVFRDIKKLPKETVKRIYKSIEKLQQDPFKGDIKKLNAAEFYFRLRVGDYRIVFQIITSDHIVIIYYIRHRKDVYSFL